MATITELQCPYCGKPLTDDEYNHALEEFKVSLEREYKEQQRKYREKFEKKMLELVEDHQTEIRNLKEFQNDQDRTTREKLQFWYDKQIEDLKKGYDDLAQQRQSDFDKLLQQRLAPYEVELYKKDSELQEIQKERANFKTLAIEEARASVGREIDERDTQIGRLKEKVDELGKQLSKTQSELKGEVGEINLLKTLKDEFTEDNFTTQTRGSATPDIIQQIRTASGELLETTIGYDNKEAQGINKHDIEKAKKDKETLGTDYFILVSRNLPKKSLKDKDGLYGEIDGILLASPDIIVVVAGIIRKAIIEISKHTASKQDRETKQTKLYDYVRGRDFCRQVESICIVSEKMSRLQDDEEKSHNTLWKKREALQKQLRKTHIDISSGLDSIIQEHEHPSVDKDRQDASDEDGMDEGPSSRRFF
jgi:hypothetical protein